MKPRFNSYIFFISSLLFSIVFTSIACGKGVKCEEPANVNNSEIVVVFKDKNTGRYLYSEVNPLYNKDSLKVFDESGNSLIILSLLRSSPDNPTQGIYVLSFGNIYNSQTDASSFSNELCRNFIIKYRYNETDTVKACFKVRKTECGSVFQPLKVYHKGQLLDSITNEASAHITIIKN